MTGKAFSDLQNCGHCANSSTMEIVAKFVQELHREPEVEYSAETDDLEMVHPDDAAHIYQLLLCPSCCEVVLRRGLWIEGDEEPRWEKLYPSPLHTPRGLPTIIGKAYDAALRVRKIDANAYAVLLRRVLELVVHDRNASGRLLADKVKDLAAKGEIPEKLVHVADGLKNLGNVGAHALAGELSQDEIPVLDELCRAILEYVYSAPHLAKLAEERLKKIRK